VNNHRGKLIFQRNRTSKEIRLLVRPTFWSQFRDYLNYLVAVSLCVAIFYTFIKYYAFDNIRVDGSSMFPTHQTGDELYVDMLTPKFSDYQRGEIIVLHPPEACNDKNDSKELFIKRVIGLPGETVVMENGKVLIFNPKLSDNPITLDESSYLKTDVKTFKNTTPPDPRKPDKEDRVVETRLAEDEYYFMGDNRPGSLDARVCGPVKKNDIIGREFYIFNPVERRRQFVLPRYNIPNV
jgi:signal peptidase I